MDTDKPFRVCDLPLSARPRERLQQLGSDKLSDVELLAILIGKGVRGEPVFKVAERLLAKFGSLKAIANASVEELHQTKGIGLAKSSQIKAGLELGNRVAGDFGTGTAPLIKTSDDVAKLLKAKLRDCKKEYFVAVLLDTRHRLIKTVDISIGSLDASIVHPREVFKEAISASAGAVIFAHNHPSGDPTPSDDDIKISKRLVEVGKLVDIAVLDHIIIGGNKRRSLKEEKII